MYLFVNHIFFDKKLFITVLNASNISYVKFGSFLYLVFIKDINNWICNSVVVFYIFTVEKLLINPAGSCSLIK